METPARLVGIAGILSALAIINWIAGGHSILGKELKIRTNPPWVAMRWFGLGLSTACFVAGAESNSAVPFLALAGAVILALGTARERALKPER